jgi:hypothetical protein
LNLRPPGYEPGELPDCSTPRRRLQYSSTRPKRRVPECDLCERISAATIWRIEAPIEHRDVANIMALLGDMQHDIHRIRKLLEGELGEEAEDPEDDA